MCCLIFANKCIFRVDKRGLLCYNCRKHKRGRDCLKTLKQLFRQPLKSFIGLVFMTLAAAVVCLCVGQSLAARNTKTILDQRFSTIAIASLQEDAMGADRLRVEQELMDWLQKMAQEHPDIVKDVSPNGRLSAYIPQLSPYNMQTAENVGEHPYDAALYAEEYELYAGTTYYDSAMLVITLDEISQPTTPMDTYTFRQKMPLTWFSSGDDWILYLNQEQYNAYRRHEDYQIYQEYVNLALENTLTEGYTVTLTGTVQQTVSLPDGMRDPVGMTARLTLTLPSLADIEALQLQPGEQYIVYGMDYFDDYQFFVAYMEQSRFRHVSFEPFDPALLTEPTDQQRKSFLENKQINVYKLYDYVPLELWQYNRFNTVSMTLCAPSNLIPYESVCNEAGEVIDRVPKTHVTYTDGSGTVHTISMEAYNDLYAIPTIARLNGSVEAFLASAQGQQWQAVLEQSQVNNRAFAVIGVEDLHQLAAFALGKTQIGEGREFTVEEVEAGAKVCLVHEWVAQQSGLQIGDTITFSFYGSDYGNPYQTPRVQELLLKRTYDAIGEPYQPTEARDRGLLRPAASLYFSTTPITETAEYTIVGFWQGPVWPEANENYYSFSANTVFIPYASVQTPMEQCDSIPFVTVVLENGTIRQFHDLVKRSGYAGRFKYSDQGYSDIAVNFHNYEALAQQVMLVGITLYVILLLLFLLLYPATQGKTVWTMQSLGCGFMKRFGHVLLSSMVIMVAASLLGSLAGMALWDTMVAALQSTAESSIALQLEPKVLAVIAAAQLLLGLLLSTLVAIVIALPRGISARR